ncbi:Dynamin-like protein ARC5 [Triticum urartu]|uniref:Dynamin-like protein ARC5 n=1 Tax=Triticum urartu TaxID=4572 RepID=M7YG73_TRIUA|nr:Dynamin-like protein ARC5 [Triticum urartu]
MGFQFNHVGGGTKTRRPIALHLRFNPRCHSPNCRLLAGSGEGDAEDDAGAADRSMLLADIQWKIRPNIKAYVTRAELLKKEILTADGPCCPICGHVQEDANHIMFDCEFALNYRQRVGAENKRLENDPSQFSAKEIIIRIEYKHCPNLTIIDTPGLILAAPGRKNRVLQSQACAVEALVHAKIQHKETIILCLEDCSDWSNATTRRVVMQQTLLPYELSIIDNFMYYNQETSNSRIFNTSRHASCSLFNCESAILGHHYLSTISLFVVGGLNPRLLCGFLATHGQCARTPYQTKSLVDPDLVRTVLVSTKLDTKIPQFARASDVEVFLHPPTCVLDGSLLGDFPFFTSVPSGRVGSCHEAVFRSNEEFKKAISLRELDDVTSLEDKLGRSLTREEKNRIGVAAHFN